MKPLCVFRRAVAVLRQLAVALQQLVRRREHLHGRLRALCKGRKHLGPGILPPCGLVGALVELAAQEAVVIAAVRQDPDSEIGVTVIAGDPTFGIKAHFPRHREDVGIVRGICHAPGIDLVSDAVALKAVL